jgi:hypothetical protein
MDRNGSYLTVSSVLSARLMNDRRKENEMAEETRRAVRTILHESKMPKSVLQIRKDMAGGLRVSSKDLGALLDEMTAAGEIFSWPQTKYWDRDPRKVVPDLILGFIAKSPGVASSKIKTALKLPLELIQPALKELMDAGRAHVWQPGKTPYFTPFEPRNTALEIILKALTQGPLTEKEIVGWVRKRLPGYQARLLKEHVSYSNEVQVHPRYGKVKTRYSLTPPEPGPYLGKAVQEVLAVQRLLAPFHVSLEAIHDAMGRELGLDYESKVAPPERRHLERLFSEEERLILEAITRLQPPGQKRALVSIRELRRTMNLSKKDFDRAVLSLASQGKVALHHHDFPTSLSQAEREALVQDERGTYYIGVVPKETSRT